VIHTLPHVAPLAALALLATPALAQSSWVDWTDETSTRLQLASVPLNDTQEKDITRADLDGDGDMDVVVVRKVPFSTPGAMPNVLLMNEGGVLVERTAALAPDLADDDDARDVLAFDADGDGWLDLVTATTFSDDPRLHINQGLDAQGEWLGLEGRFGWNDGFPVGPKFCAVYDGDVDNDGDLDLYFSDYNNSLEDRLLINDGDGFFTDETAARFPSGINDSVFGTGSFLCDFNLDGWVDILKVSGSFEPMKLLINGGGGVFTQSQTLPSTTVYMARAADFDNDGRTDIYTVSDGQDYVLYNTATNADGTISTLKVNNANSNKTGGFGGNVHEADLDRDGFLDVGVADVDVDIPGCSREFAALRNRLPQANGMTDPNNPADAPWNQNGTHDFAFLDLDGDGFEDLFLAHCNGYRVFMMEPFAVAASFGEGCAGSNGVPRAGSAGGPPTPGNGGFTVTLRDALPGASPRLLLSLAPGAFTVAGCQILVDLPALLTLTGPDVDPTGGSALALPIPNDPVLEGVRVFAQWAIPDPAGPIGSGWALSDALDVYVTANALP